MGSCLVQNVGIASDYKCKIKPPKKGPFLQVKSHVCMYCVSHIYP